jgi:hypothetical protein
MLTITQIILFLIGLGFLYDAYRIGRAPSSIPIFCDLCPRIYQFDPFALLFTTSLGILYLGCVFILTIRRAQGNVSEKMIILSILMILIILIYPIISFWISRTFF